MNNFVIREMGRERAVDLIQSTHYSKVMPRLTKHFLGCFLEDRLVGVVTLGWGTQPKATINKMFTGLGTKDYYEIGKMCMLDEMPRNSESQMLSKVVKWMKQNTPDRLFLYTWADGIVGKPGYVYQSFNFLYGGFIWTDIYVSDKGEKIHPRSTKSLCKENAEMIGKDKVFWLTYDFMEKKGIKRIKGKQFRYILPLNKRAKRMLKKESNMKWTIEYPKHIDLEWKEMVGQGEYKMLKEEPEFNLGVVEYNIKNVNQSKTIKHDFFKGEF
jgi:hypothetical protein